MRLEEIVNKDKLLPYSRSVGQSLFNNIKDVMNRCSLSIRLAAQVVSLK